MNKLKIIDAEYKGEKVKAVKLAKTDKLMKLWRDEIEPSKEVIENLANKGLKETDTIKQAKIAVEIMEVQKSIEDKRRAFWKEMESRLPKSDFDTNNQYLTIEAAENTVYIRDLKDEQKAEKQDKILEKMDRLLDKMLNERDGKHNHAGHNHDHKESYEHIADIESKPERVSERIVKQESKHIRKMTLDADKMDGMTYKQMVKHIGELSDYEVPLDIAKDVAAEVYETLYGKKPQRFGFDDQKGFVKGDADLD